jgi:hypothetical protein
MYSKTIKSNGRGIIVLGICSLILMLAIGPAEGLSVSGSICQKGVVPGGHFTHKMVIGIGTNERPTDISISTAGLEQGMDGINVDVQPDADTSPYSARTYLNNISPSSFHLDPGQSKSVVVEGDVPADVGPGGRYAFISIQRKTLRTASGTEENTTANSSENVSDNAPRDVYISVAINVPVVLTIAGTQLDRYGEIKEVNFVNPATPTQQDLSIILKNTGNYHYKAMAKSVLKDAGGNIVTIASTPVTFSSIVPPYSRKFDLSLKPSVPLIPGTYTIISTVNLEDGTVLSSKETQFSIAQNKDNMAQGNMTQIGMVQVAETEGNTTEPQIIF